MKISMDEAIAKFPDFLAEARERSHSLSPTISDVKKIFVLGMGGSALGGDLLAALLEKISPVPVSVVRNDTIPAALDQNSLVFAVSYSGDTAETLSAARQAQMRTPGKMIAISTGGKLKEWSLEKKIPHLEIPGGLMPRAALPYTFAPLLFLSQKILMFDDQSAAFDETIRILKSIKPPDRKIAESLQKKITIIYAANPSLFAAAKRWKGQINENAKQPAYAMELPEAAHNEIVGYTEKLPVHQSVAGIFLSDAQENESTKARLDFFKKAMQKSGCSVHEIFSEGKSFLAKLLSLCYIGDQVSLQLAKLLNVDPTPIAIIDQLKMEMKNIAPLRA